MGNAQCAERKRDDAVNGDARNDQAMATLLGELVAIPTVSSDPARLDDIRRSAAVITAQLEARGFVAVVADGDGALPTVIATRDVRPQHPTVILYSHHDVQPTGDPALWGSDPFVATRRGAVLFGRGSGDNKAGVVAHLAAIDAVADLPDPPGIVMVIDGHRASTGFSRRTSRISTPTWSWSTTGSTSLGVCRR
jgi:acetylornithine deacetylase/succinyl-diaminopimelate desuccinylase-like protein